MSKTSEIYQKVTENILNKLETAGSWQKLWNVQPPISLNGHLYNGINFLLLSSDDYPMPVYGTFNQIRKNGGRVRSGEKSQIIVFWDKVIDRDPDTGAEDVKFFLKYYHVFNVDQAEFDDTGKERIAALVKISTEHKENISAESIIASMPNPPKIVHDKSDRASYSEAFDRVRLPEIKWFKTPEEYYATLFHELCHATGHKSRLGRLSDYKTMEDSRMDSYSKEELVAELGASFLCSAAGLEHNIENSAAYIAGWSKHLKDHHAWLVWAAKKAELASNLILNVKVWEAQP